MEEIIGVILAILLVIVTCCGVALIPTVILWAIWNFVLCAIFTGLPAILFWQMFLIIWFVSLVGRLIFKPIQSNKE